MTEKRDEALHPWSPDHGPGNLEWLSKGASQAQILADYPQLETDDFLAVYAYAAELASGRKFSGG
jgi:hypothetical protein